MAHDDVLGRHTFLNELQLIASRKVNMPFRFLACNGRHIECSLLKSLIHFVAHFKRFERYSRANGGIEVLRLGAKGLCHGADCLLNNACNGAPPSCMNGCNGLLLRIIKQDRDAIGCRNTNAEATFLCDYRIDIV